MAATVHLQLPQGRASVTWAATKDAVVEWDFRPETLPGVTLAEIDASTGLVPTPQGGTFHESTADFLKSLEDRT
ncbi:MAG: hypothetical protein OXH78_02895 [Acidimicrobiaceae bacterium]|nr:hypothetical protein [Acidimicrobiaceae bacterium]